MCDKLFRVLNQESYIKYQMNGLDDPSLRKYQLLATSPLLKKEYKNNKATSEYIDSYMNAARILVDFNTDHTDHYMINFGNWSVALPCIYLCRHALELSMKDVIDKKGLRYKPTHDLQKLWDSLYEAEKKSIIF